MCGGRGGGGVHSLKITFKGWVKIEKLLSFNANVSSFSLAESPPHGLQMTADKNKPLSENINY